MTYIVVGTHFAPTASEGLCGLRGGERAFELVRSNQNVDRHGEVIGTQRRRRNRKVHELQSAQVVATFARNQPNDTEQFMQTPEIIAYLKPYCGWSNGVRAALRKYDLPYDSRDIVNDPGQRQEMVTKSGQPLSPCVEINGQMLADVSGEEVEGYLLANGLVQPNDRVPETPLNQACAH